MDRISDKPENKNFTLFCIGVDMYRNSGNEFLLILFLLIFRIVRRILNHLTSSRGAVQYTNYSLIIIRGIWDAKMGKWLEVQYIEPVLFLTFPADVLSALKILGTSHLI